MNILKMNDCELLEYYNELGFDFSEIDLDAIEEILRFETQGFESELHLSQCFDSMLDEFPDFDRSDKIAINEWFINWTDSLCKDSELHEQQYLNYTYIGKYS